MLFAPTFLAIPPTTPTSTPNTTTSTSSSFAKPHRHGKRTLGVETASIFAHIRYGFTEIPRLPPTARVARQGEKANHHYHETLCSLELTDRQTLRYTAKWRKIPAATCPLPLRPMMLLLLIMAPLTTTTTTPGITTMSKMRLKRLLRNPLARALRAVN